MDTLRSEVSRETSPSFCSFVCTYTYFAMADAHVLFW